MDAATVRNNAKIIWILLLSLPAGLAGCRLPYKVQVGDGGAPEYSELNVSYTLRSSRLTSDTDPETGIRQASAIVEQTPLDGTWPEARLKIEYPHPESRTGYARASLRIGRTPILPERPSITHRIADGFRSLTGSDSFDSCNPGLHDEVWALDVPKEDIDEILIALARRGYFDDQTRPTGEASIRVQVDRGSTEKVWTSEPALDELIQRIRSDGWIAGFIECEESGIQQTGWSF